MGLELGNAATEIPSAAPGNDSNSRLWVDRGVVGVPTRRESRSTTPKPFALAETRRSFANVTKEMEVRSQADARLSFENASKTMEVRSHVYTQSSAELSNEIAQRASTRRSQTHE